MSVALTKSIYAILIAFTANIILCPIIIPYLRKLKFGQNIRDDGPQSHLKKKGTPTMGGIMIIFSMIISSLFFLKGNMDGLIIIFVTLGYGLIGFWDDYIKIVKKRSLGLRAYQKIIGQLIITTIFLFYVYSSPTNYLNLGTTQIWIPFSNGLYIDLGILYIPFVYMVMIGTVNSVNITDGLDGLAAGVTVMVTTFFIFILLQAGSPAVYVAGAATGSLMGFLLYNAYPAKVFMGDTGSLALGGFIGSIAILLKLPIILVIVGIIYVIETLSVIIQVVYFKLTKQRFFKMAPIHHSFELSGWSETKVVTLFYIVTAIACLIGFLSLNYIYTL